MKPDTTNRPVVSVIIPTHNRPQYLRAAVASVIDQSLTAIEIIVVNDAGCDVEPVLAKIGDRRIKLVNRLGNGGVAAARNSGLRTARGRYVSFLDDDDRLYDHHLETLVDCIESRPEKVVYSDALVVSRDPEGRRNALGTDKVEMSREYNRALLYVMNLAQPLCFLFERELLGGSTWFDESFRTHEDWDFWIRLSDKSPFHHLAEVTCEYRRHTDGSNLSGDPRAMLETMKKIYARTALAVSNYPEISQLRQKMLLSMERLAYSTGTGERND